MTKTIKVHKRHTTFADTCITITGADLPCYRDWNEYSGYLSHIGSDAAFKSWWLADDMHGLEWEDGSTTDAECVLAHGGNFRMPKHMPLGVRPILLFNSDLSRWEDGDTFVFVDTDFIVVDENEGVALSLTCVDSVPYQKLKVALDEWFDNRIDAPLNTYTPSCVPGSVVEDGEESIRVVSHGEYAYRCSADGRRNLDGDFVCFCCSSTNKFIIPISDNWRDTIGCAAPYKIGDTCGYVYTFAYSIEFYPAKEGGNNP